MALIVSAPQGHSLAKTTEQTQRKETILIYMLCVFNLELTHILLTFSLKLAK